MSYTKLTDFAVKDSLLSGNPSKLVRGVELDAEFDAIVTADSLNLKAADAATIYPSNTVVQNSSTQILTGVAGTDAITGSLTPTLTSYVAGQTFRFVAAGANTGAVTLNINSLGAKAVTKSGTQPLEVGDIASGAAIQVVYDGTQFQLTSGAGGGAKAGGVFYENSTTLTSNYTLTTGKNAMMAGPLTIDTGVTLTIPSGQRLVVL